MNSKRTEYPGKRMDDRELMLRVKAGDHAAFESLVEGHRDRTVNFLYRMVGDADEAEDLAQEAFLRVYKARRRYEPMAQFSTWLYRISYNLALSHYRQKGRRRFEALGEAPATNPGPEAHLASQETVRHVWEALDALPPKQRMALVLTRFEDCSYERAAEVMKTTKAAIRSLVARARETLRHRLRAVIEVAAATKPAVKEA